MGENAASLPWLQNVVGKLGLVMDEGEAVPATPAVAAPVKRRRGRPRIESCDQLLGQPVRMSILNALACADAVPFMTLRAVVSTNDGNLSIHARKLERAGYIKIEKAFAGRVPRTDYSLTDAGRQALDEFRARARRSVKA
jgi:DNA-binding MarR family transcriptional regulator